MNLQQIERFARETINEHIAMYPDKLAGLQFGWTDSKRALGVCSWRGYEAFGHTVTIKLSRPLMQAVTSQDVVINTVLHEIAHALAGRGQGHNHVWRHWAIKVGAKPERCASEGAIDNDKVDSKYVGTCPECGWQQPFHRQVKRTYGCVPCCRSKAGGRFDRRFALVITQKY